MAESLSTLNGSFDVLTITLKIVFARTISIIRHCSVYLCLPVRRMPLVLIRNHHFYLIEIYFRNVRISYTHSCHSTYFTMNTHSNLSHSQSRSHSPPSIFFSLRMWHCVTLMERMKLWIVLPHARFWRILSRSPSHGDNSFNQMYTACFAHWFIIRSHHCTFLYNVFLSSITTGAACKNCMCLQNYYHALRRRIHFKKARFDTIEFVNQPWNSKKRLYMCGCSDHLKRKTMWWESTGDSK